MSSHYRVPRALASPRRRITLWVLGLAAGVCALLMAAAMSSGASAHPHVAAHAKLGHADPAIGAVLKTAPTTVTLTFVEDTTPSGSNIVVFGDKGEQVSTGTATVNPSDAKTMTVDMKGDDSETYVVVFHTVSADDGHAYADAYQFTVSSSATASAGQQPDAAGDSISSVSRTPSSSGASGVQPLIAALIGIVGLIVGAAGGFVVARSQRAT
jgi:methionine-rich copper-binding protein CopC